MPSGPMVKILKIGTPPLSFPIHLNFPSPSPSPSLPNFTKSYILCLFSVQNYAVFVSNTFICVPNMDIHLIFFKVIGFNYNCIYKKYSFQKKIKFILHQLIDVRTTGYV